MKKVFGILLLLVSLCVFLFPDIYTLYLDMKIQDVVLMYQEKYPSTLEEGVQSAPAPLDELYAELQEYNQQIYENHQVTLLDTWSYEHIPSGFDLEDDLLGYIEIPAMDITLPLYMGATTENMAKGAVVLGETSIPIGGENTNSVIAGHRGYQGAPYFREIEKLTTGDEVLVTNPWETLIYVVTEIRVIDPDNLDAVLIQPGKDMVTLITCHPYRSHGEYRYLVYCERKLSDNAAQKTVQAELMTSTGGTFVSSEPDIQTEATLRMVGTIIIILMMILLIIRRRKNPK